MDEYQDELQALRPDDEIQGYEYIKGYEFITTAGHGYLVVPRGDKLFGEALKIVNYGYRGQLAIYLEEDVEAGQLLSLVGGQA